MSDISTDSDSDSSYVPDVDLEYVRSSVRTHWSRYGIEFVIQIYEDEADCFSITRGLYFRTRRYGGKPFDKYVARWMLEWSREHLPGIPFRYHYQTLLIKRDNGVRRDFRRDFMISL